MLVIISSGGDASQYVPELVHHYLKTSQKNVLIVYQPTGKEISENNQWAYYNIWFTLLKEIGISNYDIKSKVIFTCGKSIDDDLVYSTDYEYPSEDYINFFCDPKNGHIHEQFPDDFESYDTYVENENDSHYYMKHKRSISPKINVIGKDLTKSIITQYRRTLKIVNLSGLTTCNLYLHFRSKKTSPTHIFINGLFEGLRLPYVSNNNQLNTMELDPVSSNEFLKLLKTSRNKHIQVDIHTRGTGDTYGCNNDSDTWKLFGKKWPNRWNLINYCHEHDEDVFFNSASIVQQIVDGYSFPKNISSNYASIDTYGDEFIFNITTGVTNVTIYDNQSNQSERPDDDEVDVYLSWLLINFVFYDSKHEVCSSIQRMTFDDVTRLCLFSWMLILIPPLWVLGLVFAGVHCRMNLTNEILYTSNDHGRQMLLMIIVAILSGFGCMYHNVLIPNYGLIEDIML